MSVLVGYPLVERSVDSIDDLIDFDIRALRGPRGKIITALASKEKS